MREREGGGGGGGRQTDRQTDRKMRDFLGGMGWREVAESFSYCFGRDVLFQFVPTRI